MLEYDLHTHSTYSDGSDLRSMVQAAREAGLSGIGITDHCTLIDDNFGRSERFALEETYEDRRQEIEAVRETADIEIYDGVEVCYSPTIEDRIADFLDEASFDYAIGSVHFADGYDFTTGAGTGSSSEERQVAVDRYFERQIDLVESGLFEVIAHVDLPNRLPALRDLATEDHYRRLATALATSRTVPEINAGRIRRDYGDVHPDPAYLDAFDGLPFVAGSDAHRPHELEPRVTVLDTVFQEYGLTRLDPDDLPA